MQTATRAAPVTPRISRRTVLLAVAALVAVCAGVWTMLSSRQSRSASFAGARSIQITSTGHASNPIPSPDGSRLAYAEERCGNGICHSDLMLHEMNGVGVAAVVAESNRAAVPMSWSPDGRWVLFAMMDLSNKEVTGLYIVSQRGGAPRRVIQGATSAAFVARDTLLVLSESGPAYWLRRQVVPDGGIVDSVRLPFTGTVYGVGASASGRWLSVRTAIAKDSVMSVIFDRAGRPTDTTSLYKWDPSTRDAMLMTRGADATDGSGERALVRRRINAQGRLASEEMLAAFTAHDDFRAISADGRQIFFEVRLAAEVTRWTASRRDTGSEFQAGRVLAVGMKPSDTPLSPGGGWILAPQSSQNGGSAGGVEVEPFHGGARVMLDPHLTQYVDMAFSPRDDSVAVVTSDGKDRLVITLYPLPSGRPVRISSLAGEVRDLEWLSDGRLVSHDETGQSVRIFGRTGETRDFPFPDSLGNIVSASRSPVAPELALLSKNKGMRNNASAFISRMDMNTGKVTLITRVPTPYGSISELSWSTDGYLRFVIDNQIARNGTLMRVPVAGGAIELEPPLTFVRNGSVNFLSHDGLRAVVSSQSGTTDIWYMVVGKFR